MRTFCCLLVAIPIALLSMSSAVHSFDPLLNRFKKADSTTIGKYTVVMISNDASVSPVTVKRLVDAFFVVYPLEADRFNPKTLTCVTMMIDTAYKGVAATGGGVVRINPQWLINHPEDIDVVTHEVMHIVQDYRGRTPGWLTEGIADYARYVYGVNNKLAEWRLPDYKPTQSYRNAYRVTARFLLWVEKRQDGRLVDKLDAALRDGTYTPGLWVKMTGSTVDALWDEYSKDPTIDLSYK